MSNVFIPPMTSQPLVGLVKLAFPAYAELAHDLQIVVDDQTKRIFDQIQNSAAIVCPNHPTPQDPIAVFGLSSSVHQTFHYMTAREVFMEHPSARSLWLESLGCYSVARGLGDRECLRATKRLLLKGHQKVVIFPEGEITHQNEQLMRFEQGPARIALDVCKARARAGIHQPLYLVPVALVYRFNADYTKQLLLALEKLEASFEAIASQLPVYLRIFNCFLSLLDAEEDLHRLKRVGTFSDRVQTLLVHATGELELEMLKCQYQGEVIDRLHRLKSILVRERFDEHREPDDQHKSWYRSIRRLTRLIAVNADSMHSDMTQEQQAELLSILSWEVFNRNILPKFDQTVFIAAAEPIDVAFYGTLTGTTECKALTEELQRRCDAAVKVTLAEHPARSGEWQ